MTRKIPGTLLIEPTIEAHRAGPIKLTAANEHGTTVRRLDDPEHLHSSPVARPSCESLCIRILNNTMHVVTMDSTKEASINWPIPQNKPECWVNLMSLASGTRGSRCQGRQVQRPQLQASPGIGLRCRCRMAWHVRGRGRAGHTSGNQESCRHDKQPTCIPCPAVPSAGSLHQTHNHGIPAFLFGPCSVPACDHQEEAPSMDPDRVEPLHLHGKRSPIHPLRT